MFSAIVKLFTNTKIPTTREIHDQIVAGKLTVDFGRFFLGYTNPMKVFLAELLEEDIRYHCYSHYSAIVGAEIGIIIIDNVVKFHKYQSYGSKPDGEYNPIEIDADVEEVNTGTFEIPSGVLFIANNFSGKVNPEPEDKLRFRDYRLDSYQGRKRLCKWYLKNNKVAYGQMGNMGMCVYYNAQTKHIILGRNLDYEKRSKTKEFRKILKGYKEMGSLSLSMWRWEAADSQTILSKSTLEEEKDIIQIPVDGTTARFEHYYYTLNKSPLTKHCFAQIWIE